MAPKLNKKIVINVGGLVIALAVVGGLYFTVAGPRFKEWRKAVGEIKDREKRLKQLRNLFNKQNDPRVELNVLKQEIKTLKRANNELEKMKKAGMETKDLPPELNDPDPAIRRELYRDYMREVMEVTEKTIKQQLSDAKITPPSIKLYDDLRTAEEAAYYMNRAGGLQGIVNAMGKTQARAQAEGGNIVFQKLVLENYKKGMRRRREAINVLSYGLNMTMDVNSLMSFIYYLQEEDGYYFVDEMKIKPGVSRRGVALPIEVGAKISTLMVFKSQAKSQVKKAAAKTASARKKKKGRGGPMGGLLGLAAGMKQTVREEKHREKKWYQFWK